MGLFNEMGMESFSNPEVSESREAEIEKLEPRQPFTIPEEEKEMTKDGEPCVAATPYVEIAIFRALVSGRSGFGVSVYSPEDSSIELRASREALKEAEKKKGYVYVLSREGFAPRIPGIENAMEWRSEKSVKPEMVIEVTFKDISEKVKIIEK